VDVLVARAERDDVDALLISPDRCIAWALTAGARFDAPALRAALGRWFGG
jgi:hypothetical protein